MKQITATGQSVEEAVESALATLNTTRDRVEIEIVDEGKKGFFGLFGSRQAVVKVTLPPDAIEEAVKFLKDVSDKMAAPVQVDVIREGKNVIFQLSGEKIALLIGKRGQTLNSLQYLTQLVTNRYSRQYLNITVDAEDYRRRRNDTLIQLAERMANKAMRTGKEVSMEPMPPYERKVIHTALMNYPKIKTTSNGTEPHRHLVITPTK
ncbi:protein jag [Peribacillus cavernae]|uniref:RNA-binding protein KhpB n=1 Tax=Peribacillus cavernae TaxID=1674310 RepID=A0A3S0TQS5_9BACI|nr:RNA-binding cell elongation regulator Jag/EloR [Peribacillus cavernae]MDQ0220939.1 spoIIIJ-associated protein [Peribacillus cavernae]RUQ24531.1 protein jag [Peribacillus cavernae]